MVWIIKACVIGISLFVFLKMLILYFKSEESISEFPKKISILCVGFIANVLDTFGLGSFSVIVAMNKNWKLLDEKKLPGTLNGQSILPAMLQSLLFLQFVEMDLFMLILFVGGACIGGTLCSFFVSKLDARSIRIWMGTGFFVIALLILSDLLHLFPLSGNETSLSTQQLMIGAFAMIVVGMFPAIGVGIYVPTQVVLFLLGLSPLIAFPVMTTTGAIVQSTTAYSFISRKDIQLRESIGLALAGVLGVMVAVPLITYFDPKTLRWALLAVVSYNALSIWQSHRKAKTQLA